MSELMQFPVRTAFDVVQVGMPPAVRVGKPLALSAIRVRWLLMLSSTRTLSRKQLNAAAQLRPATYRTWYPMVEHGLIEARFDREWWFQITEKGRQALERVR
jgi:hypothetical protein